MDKNYITKSMPEEQWPVKPGEVFHKLTVIGVPFWAKNPNWKTAKSFQSYVRVRCICGLEKDVGCRHLFTGNTTKCSRSCKGSPENKNLKKCTKCKRYLPKESFGSNKSKKDGLATECLECRVILKLKKYGITLEEYQEKLKFQDGVCAICKSVDDVVLDSRWQPLRVDP